VVHEQLKLPGVLTHVARASHGLVAHSSSSSQYVPLPTKPCGHEHSKPVLPLMHELGSTQRCAFCAQWSMATRLPFTTWYPATNVQTPPTRCGVERLVGSHCVQSELPGPWQATQLPWHVRHEPMALKEPSGHTAIQLPSSARMGADAGQWVQLVGPEPAHSSHDASQAVQMSDASA
jgi:hypothetical protein